MVQGAAEISGATPEAKKSWEKNLTGGFRRTYSKDYHNDRQRNTPDGKQDTGSGA
jgi:hypothetical protein